MSRYIDADTMKDDLDTIQTYYSFFDSIKRTIKKYIDIQPSADVVGVRHGHWKVVSDGYGGKAYICECSECEDTVWVYKDSDRKWNYCPNCGAKMDGKEQE